MAQIGRYRGRATQEKLATVLLNACIEDSRLHSLPDCYNLKSK